MAGVEEENYLDKLLDSVGSTDSKEDMPQEGQPQDVYPNEAKQAEDGAESEVETEDINGKATANEAENVKELEAAEESEISEPNLSETEYFKSDLSESAFSEPDLSELEFSEPDLSEPDLSEDDMQRLAGMDLDSLIDDISSDSISIEDLFGGENPISDSEINAAIEQSYAFSDNADAEENYLDMQAEDDFGAKEDAKEDINEKDGFGEKEDVNAEDSVAAGDWSTEESAAVAGMLSEAAEKNEAAVGNTSGTAAEEPTELIEGNKPSELIEENKPEQTPPAETVSSDGSKEAPSDGGKEVPNEAAINEGTINKETAKEAAAESVEQAEQSGEKTDADTEKQGNAGKNKKAAAIADMEQEELPSDEKKKKKKGGFGSFLRGIFFEGAQEEPDEAAKAKKEGKKASKQAEAEKKDAIQNEVQAERKADGGDEASLDENQRLLYEMYANGQEEEETAPKKGFFAKLKYRFEQMAKKNAEEDRLEEEAEEKEYEEKQKLKEEKKVQGKEKKEEAKKQQKEKKEAKAKAKAEKPKKEKKPKPEPKPGDILKIKPMSMLLFVLFVAGVILLIVILNSSVSHGRAVSIAKANMENGNFEKAYDALSGIKLSKDDQTLYEQASVIMYVQRQSDAHDNYEKMGMRTEAVNALIKGLERYDLYYEKAKELSVAAYMDTARNNIIDKLRENYGISETEALNLVKMSEDNFTQYYSKIEAYGRAGQ